MPRAARSPRRRTALLAVGGLLALAAPTVTALTAAPALADDGCLQELPTGNFPFQTTCDDSTPPVTDQAVASPAVNVFGYVNKSTITFTLNAHYTDADPDPISFQCQFWNADTDPAPDPSTGTWTDCGKSATSTPDPTTHAVQATLTESKLADSVNAEYHLRSRAVDAGDSSITRIPGSTLGGPTTDTPDYDTSFDPAVQEVTFRVDTEAPNTFLTGVPTDSIRPDEPSVLSQDVTVSLHSNEDKVGYYCLLDKKRIGCHGGDLLLRGLGPGVKTLTVVAIDYALNVDPVPATAQFWVPRNLGLGMARVTGKSCTKVLDPASFAGDYIQCTKPRSELHFTAPSKNIRELRLIAPAGPDLGVVEVNIGEGKWYPVDLYAKKAQAVHTYLVRDEYQTPKGGQIRIRTKTVTASRPYVRVDAVLARP